MKTTLKANNAHFDELRIDSQDLKTSTPKPFSVNIGTECDTPTRRHRTRSSRPRRRRKKTPMSEAEKQELAEAFENTRDYMRNRSMSESLLHVETQLDPSSK